MANIMDYLFGDKNAQGDGAKKRKDYESDHAAYLRRLSGQPLQEPSWPNYVPAGPQQGPSLADFQPAPQQGPPAPVQPWFQNGYISVGPLLTEEEQRAQYEQQNQPPAPQQGPSIGDYQAYRQQMAQQAQQEAVAGQQRAMMQTGPQWAADNAKAVGGLPSEQPRAVAPFPPKYSDWTMGDKLRNLMEGSEEIYRKARGADPAPQGNAAVAAPQPPSEVVLPQTGPMPMARPNQGAVPPAVDPSAIPDTVAPIDPVEAIRQKQSMVDQLYPALPAQDVGQSAIDREMAADKQRQNYLAQLAFFSGITQGAGGDWQGVGKGMAGAGVAYTNGFERYQRALEKKSDRQQDATNQKYKYDTAKTDAAVKLYGDEQDRKEKNLSTTRQAIKDRQTDIDEYFKQRLGLEKGTDFNPADPTKIDQTLRDWRLSRQRGEVVSMADMSDK